MTSWQAVRRGARALWDRPAVTAAALLASTAAALAGKVAERRAHGLASAALDGASLGLGLRAALVALVGMAFTGLVVDVTLASALGAYFAPRAGAGPLLTAGLARTPALISVRAVELTLEASLAIGLGVVVLRLCALPIGPAARAAALTLTLAPVGLFLLATFAAARLAVVEAARGADAADALASGIRRLLEGGPSLWRLAGALLVATLPLTGAALVLTTAAAGARDLPSGLPSGLAGAMCLSIATLWSYVALGVFIDE